jgi:hypothetical protein
MSRFINPSEGDWILAIKKVSNGFVIQETNGTWYKKDVEDSKIIETVFQEKEDNFTNQGDDLENFCDVLYHIQEAFGIFNSKHNDKNIEIKVIKNKNN